MGNLNELKRSCTTDQKSGYSTNEFSYDWSNHRQKNSNHRNMRLSHFRSSLNKAECFYVLRSLLQQYYCLLQRYGKVVVSDRLCHVTQLGEVKIDLQIDGPGTPLSFYNQVTNSLVTVVSQLLQTVTNLALDKSWLQTRECGFFHDRIMKSIYKHHSKEEILFQDLLKEITRFMDEHQMKVNLVPAILRKKQKTNTQPTFFLKDSEIYNQTPYLAHSRVRSQSQVVSSVQHPFVSRFTISGEEQPSTVLRAKDNSTKVDSQLENNIRASLSKTTKQTKKSLYKHKMVRTEGESYFNRMNSTNTMNNPDFQSNQTYFEEIPPTARPTVEKQMQNKISSQYSIHILNAFAKEKNLSSQQKAQFQQYQGKSYRKHTASGIDSWNPRRVSIKEIGSNQTDNSKIYTRSVLDGLAREIEVKDEPGSRDYIS